MTKDWENQHSWKYTEFCKDKPNSNAAFTPGLETHLGATASNEKSIVTFTPTTLTRV